MSREYVPHNKPDEDLNGFAYDENGKPLGTWYRCRYCHERGGDGIHGEFADPVNGIVRAPQTRFAQVFDAGKPTEMCYWACPKCAKKAQQELREQAQQGRMRSANDAEADREFQRGIQADERKARRKTA